MLVPQLLGWIRLCRWAVPNGRLRSFDLVCQVLVFWIERQCFVPGFQRFRNAIQFKIGVTNMLEDNRIIVVRSFCSTKKVVQSLIKFPLSELYPTEAIEVGSVIG